MSLTTCETVHLFHPSTRECRPASRAGWTLAEMLVGIAMVTILASIVLPSVFRQLEKAQISRVIQDLTNIRMAVQTFQAELGRAVPYEIEQLANAIAQSGVDLAGNNYDFTQVAQWRGPYISHLIAPGTGDNDAIATGFGGQIRNRLVYYNAALNAIASGPESADWVAVVIEGLNGDQFELINAYHEGHEEPGFDVDQSWTSGFLRWDPGLVLDPGLELAPVYFLVVPVQ